MNSQKRSDENHDDDQEAHAVSSGAPASALERFALVGGETPVVDRLPRARGEFEQEAQIMQGQELSPSSSFWLTRCRR